METGEEQNRKQNNGLINPQPDSFYYSPAFWLSMFGFNLDWGIKNLGLWDSHSRRYHVSFPCLWVLSTLLTKPKQLNQRTKLTKPLLIVSTRRKAATSYFKCKELGWCVQFFNFTNNLCINVNELMWKQIYWEFNMFCCPATHLGTKSGFLTRLRKQGRDKAERVEPRLRRSLFGDIV